MLSPLLFLEQTVHWRILADLFLLSLFAGLYSVPLYTLVLLRSPPTHRARIMSANNILNALFMIASSLLAGMLIGAGYSTPQLFLLLGLINALVTLALWAVTPREPGPSEIV